MFRCREWIQELAAALISAKGQVGELEPHTRLLFLLSSLRVAAFALRKQVLPPPLVKADKIEINQSSAALHLDSDCHLVRSNAFLALTKLLTNTDVFRGEEVARQSTTDFEVCSDWDVARQLSSNQWGAFFRAHLRRFVRHLARLPGRGEGIKWLTKAINYWLESDRKFCHVADNDWRSGRHAIE